MAEKEHPVLKKYSRVYVEITNICNRNCSFCPGTKRKPARMSQGSFTAVCDSLVGVTDYIYLHVMGEPLTHPDLPELIEIGRSRGFKIAITTNGTLLKKRAKELLDASPYKINISLHSFEEGTNEDYLAYVNGVCDFADTASSNGILTILRLWNRGYDEGRNINTKAIIEDHFPDEWVWGAERARIRPKLHLEYGDRFEWPDSAATDMGDKVFCHGLGDHFGILVDGTVVPCCLDREGVIALGNIFTDKVEDILTGERAVSMVEGFRKKCAVEDLCKRCGYARRFKL